MNVFKLVIVMFHYVPTLSSTAEEIYFNPWKKLNHAIPKIIQFDENGKYTQKAIPTDKVLNMKKILRIIKHGRTDFFNDVNKYSPRALQDLYKAATTEHPKRKGQKRKVLTTCDKNADCTFLTCPNVKEYCILCEANLKKDKSPTKCEKFRTSFLFVQ